VVRDAQVLRDIAVRSEWRSVEGVCDGNLLHFDLDRHIATRRKKKTITIAYSGSKRYRNVMHATKIAVLASHNKVRNTVSR
tara:strand:+ start:5699 stop:5941 length:243 start_codon:yes stop_codon:yes gene_type:complete